MIEAKRRHERAKHILKARIRVKPKQVLKLRIKSAYGRLITYPDCDLSRKFADLLGLKSFTDEHLKKIKGLGFEFESVSVS